MDLKYFIFFTLGLFLLVAGCTKAELSGAAGVPLAKSAVVSSCTETDKGRDYSIRGVTTVTLSGKATLTTDSCTGNQLTEYYCDAGAGKTEKLVCPQGTVCSSGRCVAALSCVAIQQGVRVTDNSNGQVTLSSNSCADVHTLRTFSCTAQGTSTSQTSACPEGTFCSTGVVDGRQVGQCVLEVGCEQYGSGVIIANNRFDTSSGFSNACANGQLMIYSCSQSAPYYTETLGACPDGFVCPDGFDHCISADMTTCGIITGSNGRPSGVRITHPATGQVDEVHASCADSKTLLGYGCGQAAYAYEQFNGYYSLTIPAGESQECVDGVFVNSYSCENFHDVEGNPTITRTVATYRDGHTQEYRSQCASANSITVSSCTNSQIIRTQTSACSVYGGRYNTCATINGVDQCISQAR